MGTITNVGFVPMPHIAAIGRLMGRPTWEAFGYLTGAVMSTSVDNWIEYKGGGHLSLCICQMSPGFLTLGEVFPVLRGF